MFRERLAVFSIAVMAIFAFAIQPVSADWGASFGLKYESDPYDSYYGDRITTDYRRGYQTDDWVERGTSSVTESPMFSDGIRLTSWATLDRDDYDYAIASAIYYFEIPASARSLRIKVHYDGEGDTDYVNEELAGRVWIRKTSQAEDYEEYYPSEGRYESLEKPLYGDTFVLPAKKSLEIIRTSAREHVDDNGIMELHVVAEGRQRIDVKYIEVETYSYMPNVRTITKYYRDYTWRPWNNYTYWYFYTGPVFHFSDYYYVRYTYPYYHRNYIEIRRHYDDYLRIYYVSRPNNHYIHWDNVAYVRRGESRKWHRERLSKWTPQLEETRRTYYATTKTNRTVEIQRSRERVRSALANTTRRSPSAERARSSTSIQTRGEAVTDMKLRRNTDIRTRTSESRTIERTPTRTRTSDAVRSSRDEVKTTPNVRRSTSTTVERERVIKTTPQRSSTRESSKSAPTKKTQVKQKREESKRKNVQRDNSSKAPKKETKVENKKDDDDDEEEKEKKRQSSSSSSSDSSSRKKIRNR